MKTLARILIILVAFAIVMRITYVAVNAVNAGSSSTSASAPAFERGSEALPQPAGERPEMGGGWMFGLFKNLGMVAIIVGLIAIPRGLQRRKAVPVNV